MGRKRAEQTRVVALRAEEAELELLRALQGSGDTNSETLRSALVVYAFIILGAERLRSIANRHGAWDEWRRAIGESVEDFPVMKEFARIDALKPGIRARLSELLIATIKDFEHDVVVENQKEVDIDF